MIEQLENRTLLTTTLVNGTLTITTVAIGEMFTVDRSGGSLTVAIAGEGLNFTYPIGSVQRIIINSNPSNPDNRPGDIFQIGSAVTLPVTINASDGDDSIEAGNGDTSITAEGGADWIVCGSGNDTVHGGGGRAADDPIPAADDTILGGDGNDSLDGGGGPDSSSLGDIIIGEGGDDTVMGGDGADIMDGGEGHDILDYSDKDGDGVDVRFYEPAGPSPIYNAQPNPDYDPEGDLAADNYPYRGFGEVTEEDRIFFVNEHDNLFAGLSDLFLGGPFSSYNDVLGRFDLLNNDNFEEFLGGPGRDFFQVDIKSTPYTLRGGDGVDTLYGSLDADLLNAGPNEGSGRGGVNAYDITRGDGINGFLLEVGGNDTLIGESGQDELSGGPGDDSIMGGEGNDLLQGDQGNDWLDGETGSDVLSGDSGGGNTDTLVTSGNDTLLGGLDADNIFTDTLQGDGGFDIADYSGRTASLRIDLDIEHDDGDPLGGPDGQGEKDLVTDSVEMIIGGSGDDFIASVSDSISRHLVGGIGMDTLTAGAGNDTLDGGAGDDSLTDGAGNDCLLGGEGSDYLSGGTGRDTISGGTNADPQIEESDVVDYSTRTVGVTIIPNGAADDGAAGELDNITEIEQALVGSGNDVVNFSSFTHNVTLDGNGGNDTLTTGSGDDRVTGGDGNDSITTGAGGDSFSGNDGDDTLNGGDGNDCITGDAGDDSILGGAGDDSLDGGVGGDDLDGGAGNDAISYANRSAPVSISYDNVANDGEVGEFDNVRATFESMIGGSGDDTLTGGAADDSIDGGGGDDLLSGLGGNDTLNGGAGDDSLLGGAGSDSLDGGNDNDTLDGGTGADTIFGGPGIDAVSYASRTASVSITLELTPVANDGEAGEGDLIHNNIEAITGGSGNDTINATNLPQAMSLLGGAGNDTIYGGTRNDTINAGVGDDFVSGGAGNDTLLGNDGNDTLFGGRGNDSLNGGGGNDELDGETGADTIIGSGGNDSVSYAGRTAAVSVTMDGRNNDGEAGERDSIDTGTIEAITGGAGNDTFVGSSASEAFIGGAGNDSFVGNGGGDTMLGQAGTDTVDYGWATANLTITLDGVANDGAAGDFANIDSTMENIIGGAGSDNISLAGTSAAHVISAGAGNDTVTGGSGTDTIYGNNGNDVLDGGEGNDRLHGGNGNDTLNGGGGNDVLVGAGGSDQLNGGDGRDRADWYYENRRVIASIDGNANDGVRGSETDNVGTDVEDLAGGNSKDTLTGSPRSNRLYGRGGNDTLIGLNGHDTLDGGDGSDYLDGGSHNDLLIGGPGGDWLIGGNSIDRVDYSDRSQDLSLTNDGVANDGADGEFDHINGDVEILIGGSGNDSISGTPRNDTLIGNGGVDTITAGRGRDSISGGSGNDILLANDGEADTIDGGDDADSLVQDVGLDEVSNVP